MYLSDHDDVGMVIADKPGGGSVQETRWLAGTLKLTNDGTEYVTPDRVVLPIVTATSRHVPHLQLADLVTAATTAAVAGRPSGLRLRELLLALAHKHALGYAGGAGIVLWPRQPNLFYWAFGEASGHFPRRGTATTCRTPTGSTATTTAWRRWRLVAELVWRPATTHPAGYLAAVDRHLAVADVSAGPTQVTQSGRRVERSTGQAE